MKAYRSGRRHPMSRFVSLLEQNRYASMGGSVSIQHRDTFESAEGYYASLFHELTHSTGHEARLGRFQSHDVPRPFVSEDYSKEELVAELGYF